MNIFFLNLFPTYCCLKGGIDWHNQTNDLDGTSAQITSSVTKKNLRSLRTVSAVSHQRPPTLTPQSPDRHPLQPPQGYPQGLLLPHSKKPESKK